MAQPEDPFEQFRREKLKEEKLKPQAAHGEVVGKVEPGTGAVNPTEGGTGERYASGRPKGFESHIYAQVPKQHYERPKGFETDRYDSTR